MEILVVTNDNMSKNPFKINEVNLEFLDQKTYKQAVTSDIVIYTPEKESFEGAKVIKNSTDYLISFSFNTISCK